jgi:hypothetical protein
MRIDILRALVVVSVFMLPVGVTQSADVSPAAKPAAAAKEPVPAVVKVRKQESAPQCGFYTASRGDGTPVELPKMGIFEYTCYMIGAPGQKKTQQCESPVLVGC